MHWEPTHVKLMLALRTAIRSERWDEVWQDATQEHHIHLRRAREQRATQRFEAQLSSLLLVLLGFRPPSPNLLYLCPL